MQLSCVTKSKKWRKEMGTMLNEEKKWYEKAGKESDVVISTRVRLARNLADMPFPNRMTPDQKAAVERRVRDAILSGNSAIASDFDFVQMDDLSNEQAVSLVERHIVSPEFIANAKGRGFLISKDERISIMVNEEDHVRIQVLHEGLALSEAAEMADRIDTLLNESLRFAFDSELGYLTQCPTNLGTGMRASVMLHLPALTENGAMSRISTNLSKLGLVIRGTYGEGSNVIGAMYQLSNQITLGLSEKEAVENLQNITIQLISEERKTRARGARLLPRRVRPACYSAFYPAFLKEYSVKRRSLSKAAKGARASKFSRLHPAFSAVLRRAKDAAPQAIAWSHLRGSRLPKAARRAKASPSSDRCCLECSAN